MIESVGWLRVGTTDSYVWKSWLNWLDGIVKTNKSGYTRLESMVESVGWLRVGTAELYVWKSWLYRLDGTVKPPKNEVYPV